MLNCGALTLSFSARRHRSWVRTSSRRGLQECPFTKTRFTPKHIDKDTLAYTRGRPFRFVLRAWGIRVSKPTFACGSKLEFQHHSEQTLTEKNYWPFLVHRF